MLKLWRRRRESDVRVGALGIAQFLECVYDFLVLFGSIVVIIRGFEIMWLIFTRVWWVAMSSLPVHRQWSVRSKWVIWGCVHSYRYECDLGIGWFSPISRCRNELACDGYSAHSISPSDLLKGSRFLLNCEMWSYEFTIINKDLG